MTGASGKQQGVLQERLAAAREAILGWQRSDGGFPLLRWSPDGFCVSDDPLFATAVILLAIGAWLPGRSRRAALALIRHRRSVAGLWHFDAAARLPPDADDTAHALAALWRFAPVTERPTAADMSRLAVFVQANGRIMTWLDQDRLGQESTDDAVVAANAVYAMALSQPGTARRWFQAWLRRSRPAGHEQIGAPYYLHLETVQYAWRRALTALDLEGCSGRVVPSGGDVPVHSPLRCALALAAGQTPQAELVAALVQRQDPNGGWAAEPWFRAPGAVFGSAAVTTALAVEGLLRSQRGSGD